MRSMLTRPDPTRRDEDLPAARVTQTPTPPRCDALGAGSLRARLVGSFALCLGLAMAVTAAAAVPALPDAQRTTFMTSPEDPPAKELFGINEEFAGRHYLAGDEWNMELFKPFIEGKGGAYVGVGSDQSYLLMTWQRPELVFQMDYDPWVVIVHSLYHRFFLAAKDKDDLISFWAATSKDRVTALLTKEVADEAKRKDMLQIWKIARGNIHARLKMLQRTMRKRNVPTFVTDDEHFQFVVDSIRAGRVRALSANLLDKAGMIGIGEITRKLGVPVRVLYLSNAETYWPYSKEFRANIRGLHHDATGVVLRTTGSWSINKDYRYYVQRIELFAAWLERSSLRKVHQMIRRRPLEGPEDVEIAEIKTDIREVEAKRAAGKTPKKATK